MGREMLLSGRQLDYHGTIRLEVGHRKLKVFILPFHVTADVIHLFTRHWKSLIINIETKCFENIITCEGNMCFKNKV
jgi:hypothetical protein